MVHRNQKSKDEEVKQQSRDEPEQRIHPFPFRHYSADHPNEDVQEQEVGKSHWSISSFLSYQRAYTITALLFSYHCYKKMSSFCNAGKALNLLTKTLTSVLCYAIIEMDFLLKEKRDEKTDVWSKNGSCYEILRSLRSPSFPWRSTRGDRICSTEHYFYGSWHYLCAACLYCSHYFATVGV